MILTEKLQSEHRGIFICYVMYIGMLSIFPLKASSGLSNYINYMGDGFRETVSNRSNQWILAGATISILATRQFDDNVQKYSLENRLMSESLSKIFDVYGNRYAYPAGFAVVGLSAYLDSGAGKLIQDVKYFATAVIVTGGTTDLLKNISKRKRPNKIGTRSFPSGHTSGSFCVAAVMNEIYGSKIGIPLYLIATGVGLQRIHDNKHWLTDVIAGATLGTVIGRGFGKVYQKENSETISIVPAGRQGNWQMTIIIPM